MLMVPVYSGVLKLKNVNKKGLCWQAKIARHRFAHGKALSCCFCRYIYLHFCSKLIAEDLSRSPFLSSAFPVVGGLFLALFDAATPEIKRRMWPFSFMV